MASHESTPDCLDVIFAQLRLDLRAATSDERRDYLVDRVEIAVKSLELREFGRVRAEGYASGQQLSKPSGGMVPIKRQGN